MRLANHDADLTYCLNVHPGSTPAELEAAVFGHAPRVFEQFRSLGGPAGPYGVGLWLSAACAGWLSEDGRLAEFADRLRDAGLYVFTLNGFPFGTFHGRRVKQDVYSPDWSASARLDHTLRLGELLAGLLPPAGYGTISTVPVTYRSWATDDSERVAAAAANLARVLAQFADLEDRTGRRVQLLLEPEPDCLLDDAESVVRFFCDVFVPATNKIFGAAWAAELLKRHFGVCLDLAHAAVVFADPLDMLARYRDHGIPVGKVHLSAAVASRGPGPPPEELRGFTDDVYLHQTRVRTSQGIQAFPDLPDALETPGVEGDWRVHYHVPLIWGGTETLASTRDLITPALLEAAVDAGVRHFEVETYTLSLFHEGAEPAETVLALELLWAQRQFPTAGTQ